MGVPLRQSIRIGLYLAKQRLLRREKFPLLVELEPLFQCNLACAGCGKIQHPDHILRRRMSVEQAVAAVEECGAPVVSIAGGEPLLLERKLDKFKPSPYFAFAVHIDGLRERHDKSVCREGVFDKAVAAIREAKRRGFRVTTNTTFFSDDTPQTVREVLDFLNDELQVDQMMISPAYAYEKAPDQEHFPGVEQTRRLFRAAFAGGRRRKWRLNHSPFYLDFRELLEETDWSRYGRGKDPRCDNCMAHCGYEPTAINEAFRQPHKALWSALAH